MEGVFHVRPDDIDGAIFLGRLVRGLIDLHDHPCVFWSDKRLLASGYAIQEMDRFRLHGSCIHVLYFFTGHGGEREFDAALHGVDANVAMGVVHHDRAFAADHLDPRG